MQQQTISVCVIVVCMPSPLYLAACNPCIYVPFFIRNVILKKNYTSFTQQTISVRGIVVYTSVYLASFSPCMCVRAVSIFYIKNMQLLLVVGVQLFLLHYWEPRSTRWSATRSVKPGESSEGQYLLINPMQNSRMLACFTWCDNT